MSILGVGIVSLLLASLAFAHVQGTTAFDDSGNGWCMFGRGAIDGENNQVGSTVWSYTDGCLGFEPKIAGYLGTKVEILMLDDNGVYAQCTPGDWQFSTSYTYATATLETWGGPHGPCGAGWYKVDGHQRLHANSDWKYGKVRSPIHWW